MPPSAAMRLQLALLIAVLVLHAECVHGNEFIHVCHFPAWGRERNNIAKFDVKDVDPALCSHLVYAYALIDVSKNTLRPVKPSVEEGRNGKFREFNDLKGQNAKLKTLLQIRAKSSRGDEFFAVTSNPATLDAFCVNVINYLRQLDFDGISLDWRYYPLHARRRRDNSDEKSKDSDNDSQERRYTTKRPIQPVDENNEESQRSNMKERLPKLLSCLRYTFGRDKETPRLLLTILAPVFPRDIDGGFSVQNIASLVDYVYLKTFDFSQPGDTYVNFRSPVIASRDLAEHPNLHIDYALGYWNKRGLPYNKMVPGLSGIGARHELMSPSNYTPGSMATGAKLQGKYYEEIGGLAYPEICEMLAEESVKQYFSEEQKTPYLVLGDKWVGYEDAKSLKWKKDWMKQKGVAGMLFNYIDEDDFTGTMCEAGKYPLLTALNSEDLEYTRERSSSSGASAPGWFLTRPLWDVLDATPTMACGWKLLIIIYVAVCCVFHV